MPPMNPKKSDQGFALPVIGDKGPQLWRSLEEKQGDASLESSRADEFPENAGVLSAFDRRGFLQLLGGTAALAGAAGCWRPPEENIYTHTRSPDYVPGIPQHYASAVTFDAVATGVVLRSYDGRPIKVEGNSLHPASRGATTAFEQAALYGLYDPDRARELTRRGQGQGWQSFLRDVGTTLTAHQKDGGAKLRFLVAAHHLPHRGGDAAGAAQPLPQRAVLRLLARVAGQRAPRHPGRLRAGARAPV